MPRYLLIHNGQFWTGDRFSIHIGEAQQYDVHTARATMQWLTSRLNIHAHRMEAPPNLTDADYST